MSGIGIFRPAALAVECPACGVTYLMKMGEAYDALNRHRETCAGTRAANVDSEVKP